MQPPPQRSKRAVLPRALAQQLLGHPHRGGVLAAVLFSLALHGLACRVVVIMRDKKAYYPPCNKTYGTCKPPMGLASKVQGYKLITPNPWVAHTQESRCGLRREKSDIEERRCGEIICNALVTDT